MDARYFPEGINVYFDNVGGDMLEAALLNMRRRGRIMVAVMISQEGKITYVEDIAKGLKNDPATPEAMFKGRSAGKQERSQRTVERVHLLKVLETRKSALQKSKAWHLLVLLLLVLKLTIYRL
ncbi:(+)-pulegone reductase [Glycine soja]|uniref:(+)-pulegone reductase n=1 Tax=Glycine soja TaxID=3848 RepID=A0A445JXM8_GLYSO|nr:(+)-pulegone reductase [Glycine soja]